MDSIATKEININLLLSKKGKTASVMPDMKTNLISVPQLSDNGCVCQLHGTKVIATCGDTTVISNRDEETGLWTIPIETKNENATTITELENSNQTGMNKKRIRKKKRNKSSRDRRKKLLQLVNKTTNIIKQPTLEVAYNAYQQKLSAHLMAYLHVCMGAPVVKTYINAIKNNWLSTFLGLTVEAVKQHLPKIIQTTMGHMHQVRQNIRPTQKITSPMIMNETEEEITLDPP